MTNGKAFLFFRTPFNRAMFTQSRRLLLLAFLCFTLPHAALSQETATPAPSVAASPSGSNMDPAAATQAWLASIPADQRARSDAYFEGRYWLLLWDFLIGAAGSLLLLSTGISARLRDFAERRTRFKSLQVALYTIPYILIAFLIGSPIVYYRDFVREHQYGMATQTFGPWFGEQMTGLAVALIGVTMLLIVLYAVFRCAPRTWWIWGTGVAVIFSLLTSFIAPLYIFPLFNTYKPLNDPSIRDPILAMAQANEIPVKQVFEVDASRQTKRVSANVAGFLGTTRIALNDNLLKQCTLPEIRSVMAHEMGHYVLNHGVKLVTYTEFSYSPRLRAHAFVFDASVRRWGDRWGVRGIGDPAGLPLLALIVGAYFFLMTPVQNSIDPGDRARSGRFRNQHRPRTRRDGKGGVEAWRLS